MMPQAGDDGQGETSGNGAATNSRFVHGRTRPNIDSMLHVLPTGSVSPLAPIDCHEERLVAAWALNNNDGAHDLAHIRRVWRNCLRLVEGEAAEVDLEVLRPACVFHDLVNLPKDSPDRARASTLSAEAAAGLLAATGFPADKIAAVAHAIAAHSFSAGIPPESIEAKILQDADRLDSLGAVGIARVMYTSGAMNRALYDLADPMAEARTLDDIAYALDHFPAKLFTLAERMNTETGRRLATERTELMVRFCDEFLDEIG